jgi:photosystem II stability/assembly factor-like uncharacterized protein
MNRFDGLSRRRASSASWLFLLLFSGRLASAVPWAPVGPGATFAAPLRSLTVQPDSPDRVWLGMSHGGLYRSKDRGSSWTWVGRPFGAEPPYGQAGIVAIDADRSHPDRLFAATRAGVFRTDDGGTRWVKTSAPGFSDLLGNGEPQSLAIAQGALYLAAGPRLLVSTDDGRSFEVRFEAPPGQPEIRFAADRSRTGLIYLYDFAPDANRLRKSTNAGKTWSEVPAPPVSNQGVIRELAADGGSIYLQWSGDDPALWRSRNGGATWKRLLDGDFGALAIHPAKPRTLYWSRAGSGGSDVLVSRDGGETWKILGPVTFQFRYLAFDPSSGTLYGLGESALARSADGRIWETLFVPPSSEFAEVARLSFRPGRSRHQALTVGWRLYRSFDGGASWTWRAMPTRLADVALDDDPNRLVAVSTSYAYLSEDAGRTWRTTSSDLFYGEGLIRSDRDTLFAIGCGVVRSTDDGESWRVVLPCYTTDAAPLRWTAKLDVDPARLDRIYTLSFQAEIDGLPHGPLNDWPSFLWRSEDGGKTWKKTATNLRAFALERGSGRLFGVRGTNLLESDDAGRNWRVVGTAPSQVLDLIVDPATAGALYAVGYAGLKWSPDRGTTWQTVSPSGGWLLQFDPANPKVLYTAIEDGVYRLALP